VVGGCVVRTQQGEVAGVREPGAVRFRGIPFAAPPFGANRLRPPQRPAAWSGVRDAAERRVGVPQGRPDGDPFDGYFNPPEVGEDCLTLDVWTPDPGTSGLPVMVWIHGGGFVTGTGSAPAHDGWTFARDGIVHVGLNYRLGVDGFTFFDDGVENLGLLDQVAALEWVQENIAAFGGDPHRVTVFGQSAGAIAVMDLLAMPRARGLVARAIAMSGSPSVSVPPEVALRVTAALARRLGTAPRREAFARLPLERVVAETWPMVEDFADIARWGAESFMVSPFRAVHGTATLPETPLAVAAASTVPLLTGTVTNETSGFLTALGLMPTMPDAVAEPMLALLGGGRRDLATATERVEAAWTEAMFRRPTLALAAARTAPTHVYEFRWESPMFPQGLGANHALDVPFMRDDLAAMRRVGPAGEAMLGPGAPQGLATRMHDAFAAFARTGNPGWPAYGPRLRSTMVFDAESVLRESAA
jgi:para-nitrobenzyl esterase